MTWPPWRQRTADDTAERADRADLALKRLDQQKRQLDAAADRLKRILAGDEGKPDDRPTHA